MKVRCSQCGASLAVMEREFYLRCPYCGARNLLRSPGAGVLLVMPARSMEQIRRLFPAASGVRIRLRFYPYQEVSGRLRPFFTLPAPDLAGYIPPAGATTVFSEDAVDPDDLTPMAGDPSGSRVVFHPFYVVNSTDPSFEAAILIDAVSGLRPGTGSGSCAAVYTLPSRSFLTSLIWGGAASAIAYTIAVLSGASTATALALCFPTAFAGSAASYLLKALP